MELIEVINKISTMYREELNKKGDVQLALVKIDNEFESARKDNWETMSYAKWAELNNRRDALGRDREFHATRAMAMFQVREMFLELLEAEVDSDTGED